MLPIFVVVVVEGGLVEVGEEGGGWSSSWGDGDGGGDGDGLRERGGSGEFDGFAEVGIGVGGLGVGEGGGRGEGLQGKKARGVSSIQIRKLGEIFKAHHQLSFPLRRRRSRETASVPREGRSRSGASDGGVRGGSNDESRSSGDVSKDLGGGGKQRGEGSATFVVASRFASFGRGLTVSRLSGLLEDLLPDLSMRMGE